jgi:tRNA C32,U32 (ribose-2'-O)-methylase TrmJ
MPIAMAATWLGVHTNQPLKRRDVLLLGPRRASTRAAAAGAAAPTSATSLLASTTIVLVSPKSPENVGAAARAAANYGARALAVAGPRFEWADAGSDLPSPIYVPAARRVARGSAATAGGALLAGAIVAPDLGGLLPLLGPAWAVAVTRRAGTARAGPRSWARPADLVAAALASSAASPPPLALVFGREESGLTDAEVALCGGGCLALPTPQEAEHGSLNLGAAVAVTLSLIHEAEFCMKCGSAGGAGSTPSLPALQLDPATPADIDAVVDRVAALAARVGLAPGENSGPNHGRKRRSAGNARAVLTRAGASRSEVAAVHLLLRAVEVELGRA